MDKDKISNFLIYSLFLFIIGIFIVTYEPFPPDDFLRHIRYLDYQSEGGYTYMYPFSQFDKFNFNPWFGFDLIAGTLQNVVGGSYTILTFQIVFISLFFIAIIINIRNPAEEKSMIGVYIFLFFLLLTICVWRLTLIRPTILIAIITLICLKGRGSILGFTVTAMSAFLYYLYFLFFIPLAVAHYFKGCRKFAIGVTAGVIISSVIWIYQTDYEIITVLSLIVSGMFGREGLAISENAMFASKLTNPVVFVIALFFVASVIKKKKVDICLLLIIFTIPLSLQARYFLDLALPLMFIYAVNNSFLSEKVFTDSIYKTVVDASAIVSIIFLFPAFITTSFHGDNRIRLDGINLQKGSVAFSESLEAGFSVIYWNKELIKVIPAAEVGWSDKETKKMVKTIGEEKKIDSEFCSYQEKYGITHVITSQAVSGECLRHVKTFNKGFRVDLFEVKK